MHVGVVGMEVGDKVRIWGADVTENSWRLDIVAKGIGGVTGRFMTRGGQLELVTPVSQSLKLLLQLLSDGEGVEYAMSSTGQSAGDVGINNDTAPKEWIRWMRRYQRG